MKKILSLTLAIVLCAVSCPAQSFNHLAPSNFFAERLGREAAVEVIAIGMFIYRHRDLDNGTLSGLISKEFGGYYGERPRVVSFHFDQMERIAPDAMMIPFSHAGREYVICIASASDEMLGDTVIGDISLALHAREDTAALSRWASAMAKMRDGTYAALKRQLGEAAARLKAYFAGQMQLPRLAMSQAMSWLITASVFTAAFSAAAAPGVAAEIKLVNRSVNIVANARESGDYVVYTFTRGTYTDEVKRVLQWHFYHKKEKIEKLGTALKRHLEKQFGDKGALEQGIAIAQSNPYIKFISMEGQRIQPPFRRSGFHGEVSQDCQLLVYKGSVPFDLYKDGKVNYGEFYNLLELHAKARPSLQLNAVLSVLEKPAAPAVAVVKAAPPAPVAVPKINEAQLIQRIQDQITVFEKAGKMKDAKGAAEKIQTALARIEAVSKGLDMEEGAKGRYRAIRSSMQKRLEEMREKLRAEQIAKAAVREGPEVSAKGVETPQAAEKQPAPKTVALASRGLSRGIEEEEAKMTPPAPKPPTIPTPAASPAPAPAPSPEAVRTPEPVRGTVDADMLTEKIVDWMDAFEKAQRNPDLRKAAEEAASALQRMEAAAKGLDMTPEALEGYEAIRNIMKERLDVLRKSLSGKVVPATPLVPVPGRRSGLLGAPDATRSFFEVSL